mgnify:CR=1 FL=1
MPDKECEHPNFPFLCLLVSGGHTQIVKVNSPFDMEIVGSTIDDAAGEALDKWFGFYENYFAKMRPAEVVTE